jgi:hypothetical protein
MPCIHKFSDYLYLNKVDFEPETLIIGTFNPSWPQNNYANWFYGRTDKNNFWDVLPRLYSNTSLINNSHNDWKLFCSKNKIAITDLIYSVDDALPDNKEHQKWLSDYSDKNIAEKFHRHTCVDIISLIAKYSSIRNVYLTRSANEKFWKEKWKPIAKYCSEKNIASTCLLTPSGYAFYQLGAYNNKNPSKRIEKLEDYILREWKAKWHF